MPIAKQTGRTLSVPSGVTIGVCSAAVLTLLGSAITAKLVDKQWLPQENIGYAIMIMLMIAAWTGATVAYKKIRRRKVMIAMLTGTTFYVTLLGITALLFGGQYSGAGETALLILGGSMVSVFLNFEAAGRKNTRKRKKYNR